MLVGASRPPWSIQEQQPAPNKRFSRFPRRLTGSRVPDLIVSMSSQMWLHLQSDDSIASPGFKAVYQGRDTGVSVSVGTGPPCAPPKYNRQVPAVFKHRGRHVHRPA